MLVANGDYICTIEYYTLYSILVHYNYQKSVAHSMKNHCRSLIKLHELQLETFVFYEFILLNFIIFHFS